MRNKIRNKKKSHAQKGEIFTGYRKSKDVGRSKDRRYRKDNLFERSLLVISDVVHAFVEMLDSEALQHRPPALWTRGEERIEGRPR